MSGIESIYELTPGKFKTTEVGFNRMLAEMGSNYSDPFLAFKEYPTNGLDACDRAEKENEMAASLWIQIVENRRRILVTDSAFGMSGKKIRDLPNMIGESDKVREDRNERGEKAIGLTAYATFGAGSRVHILSKTPEEKDFGCLILDSDDRYLFPRGPVRISAGDMDEHFYGRFEHGTRVAIDFADRHIFKQFSISNLRKFLRETYLPLLVERPDERPIYVGRFGEEAQQLTAPDFKGTSIGPQNVSYRTGDGGQTHDFPLKLKLFVNPEINDGKVGVFTKDVRVYNSILQLEEKLADLPLWNCRQVFGYINNRNFKLTLGREAISKGGKNTNAYLGFIRKLRELNDELWPDVEKILAEGKVNQINQDFQNAMNRVRDAYQLKNLVPINVVSGGSGVNGVKDVIVNEDEIIDKPETKRPRPEKETINRKFPFVIMEKTFTDRSEEKFRSKIDMELGRPTIIVNRGHLDFHRYVLNGTQEERDNYLNDMISDVIPIWEAADAETRGKRLGTPEQTAMIIARRAQDLRYALRNNKNRRKR